MCDLRSDGGSLLEREEMLFPRPRRKLGHLDVEEA